MASVNKRKWTKPDGSTGEAWIVRYKDGPAHRQKTFERKKEADAFARKVENEMEAGTHVSRARSRTISQLIDEVLADLGRRRDEGQVGESYVKQNRITLAYARLHLGHVVAADLTWQQVDDYGRKLRGMKSRVYGQPLSAGTIQLAMAALNLAVGFGVRRGYAARNVVGDAMKELGSLPAAAIETFTQDEIRLLLGTIEDRPAHISRRGQALMRCMVYLAVMCGLRKGEILALTWDDIDFKAGQVRVSKSLTPADLLKGPKTASGRRVVPLSRLAAQALEQWRRFAVLDGRGLLFRTKGGTAITDTFYRDAWYPLLRRAQIATNSKVGHRHFHALRHFAGSAWLDAGVPLPEVSRMLGHANVMITARVYSHVIQEVHHRADQLDACAANLLAAPLPAIAHGMRTAA
ncbi:site-specific integrase [Sphingomonas sp. MG17]|uniref:Site-specific integrase n=1 Tax=Sphingomonas tagetis TaxID=2949092 RepID=A0A9X2HR72_9SPHN|nr:site-specific integrase [Sphingomonas tagetis]MCP3732018.1 site-specific integrase [Sphingomonas tagetis]